MKRILITGITGFVGTNLTNYFAASDDLRIFGHSRNIQYANRRFENIEFIPEITANHLDRYLIDTIVHLAGIAHDLSGKYRKEDYLKYNFKATVDLYNNFLNSDVNRFVFVSSVKALVDHSNETIDEKFKPEPTSNYGISKQLVEQYILENQKTNKKSYILRPCMIHGPGNKGNLNLLYKFVNSGLPYPLTAFENRRSYLSIENFCFVIKEIIQDRLVSGDYMLSDKESISTLDLIKIIASVTNRKARMMSVPRSLMRAVAKLGSLVKAPFNSHTLEKLVGNLVVSNGKLLANLGQDLPVTAREGFIKTIRSFDE